MVLGKQGRRVLKPKVPPHPRTGVAEEDTFPCPRHCMLASALLEITPLPAACPPIPDIRAPNLVGRFFLPLVPIETFLQAPIWDRAQREHKRLTLLLAPGCAKGRVGSVNHTERRLLLWHKEAVRWGLPMEPGVSKRRCRGHYVSPVGLHHPAFSPLPLCLQ